MRVSPLVILRFLTIIIMLALIMTKKTSPLMALIVVSMVTNIISCFFIAVVLEGATEGTQSVVGLVANFKSLGDMITSSKGVGSVVITGVMFIFSILLFDILTDAGTFHPVIKGILNLVGTNPVKIGISTAVLVTIVHLDGSGAVTFLICVPALLPLYDALGTCRTTLVTIVILSAGTMNVLLWGGPTIRAATTLGMGDNPVTFFLPVLPAVPVDLVCVLIISASLGVGEKKRIGTMALQTAGNTEQGFIEERKTLLRSHLFRVNIILIVTTIVFLLSSGFAPVVVFMAFCVLVTVISYPGVKDSEARVDAYAKEVLMVCSMLFAADYFTGIMQDTGMIIEMVSTLVPIIPHTMGRFPPLIIGIIGMPASPFFDPDSFYYGVLSVLTQTAEGSSAVGVDIDCTAILGQMIIGFLISPSTVSTFPLVGLSDIDFGEHQKRTTPLAWLVSLVTVVIAILTRGIVI